MTKSENATPVEKRIATWSKQMLGNAQHLVRLLPPDYTTIEKISRLDEITVATKGPGTMTPYASTTSSKARAEIVKMQVWG